LGEALSAEAKLRPTEKGGKDPPEAKSFGKSSAENLKRREMPPPPLTSDTQSVTRAAVALKSSGRSHQRKGQAMPSLRRWSAPGEARNR